MGAKTKKITLGVSGKKIVLDISKMNIKDYRSAVAADATPEIADVVVAKCLGMTVEDLVALPYEDYHEIGQAWRLAVSRPLRDEKRLPMTLAELEAKGLKYGELVEIVSPDEPPAPNSQSASTSE